jgi:hypothetical protein
VAVIFPEAKPLVHKFTVLAGPNDMSNATLITPGHIKLAKAALVEAGIPAVAGTLALDLAVHFYHQTPQVSRTDALRRERNQLQDALETVSCQLQQERAYSRRLTQEVEAARQQPKVHQQKAYRLRKLLRTILTVLQHPQAKEMTKLARIAKLVITALTDNPPQPLSSPTVEEA